MTGNFEQQKNVKAAGYTALIIALLLLIFISYRWAGPVQPEMTVQDGIEVNLGSSDQGLGDDQPMSPESPAPTVEQHYSPPQTNTVVNNDIKNVETDDNATDAPTIKKPDVPKPNATKVSEREVAKKPTTTATTPVTNPVPAPPKPKALMGNMSGTGKGGNEADDYRKGGNQGVAGGVGDQGRPGGNPNSTNYEGNGGSGTSGVSISRGLQGRKITTFPSFEDDFNENAKVAMDIKVDANGKVISAEYQPKGSTTSNNNMKAIARRKALQLKFNPGESDEQIGTIVFNFRLKN